jgi:hypothetical protein
MLEDVGGSADDERRHGRGSRRLPALALLRDHHRLEVDAVRTKELLGQSAERSAGVREEDGAP